MKEMMKVHKNVISGQCRNSLVRIQIGYKAIFLGYGWIKNGWSGLQLGFFAPAHNSKKGYKRIKFFGRFLPGMPVPMVQWPKWYKWLHKKIRYKFFITFSKGWK